MIGPMTLLAILGLAATPATAESLPRRVENNVRILSVSPTPPDSGTVMTWITFSGIVDDRAVIFFSLHPAPEAPPPVYDDLCDVEYHLGPVDGAVGGRFTHVSNVNVIDRFACRPGH
jgi:hypothetical protein